MQLYRVRLERGQLVHVWDMQCRDWHEFTTSLERRVAAWVKLGWRVEHWDRVCMITFAPRDNEELEANRRVKQWHVIRLDRGKVLIAESLDYLHSGDMRWIDRSQLLQINDPS